MKHEYFKKWIQGSEWAIRIAIFLMLLCSLVQFGAFALSQNYVVSYFGAQTEDVTFALQITYVGILITLPLQFRFLRYFETRSYLLLAMLAQIFLNVLILNTQDFILFCVLRFITGIVVCLVAGGMLTLIYSRIKSERMQALGSSVFYGTVLSNGVIIGVAMAWVNSEMNWIWIYYFLIGFQLICLLILLLMMKPVSGHKRYPLYQMDWVSVPLLAAGFCALAYTLIYGTKYYWFGDDRILRAVILFIICAGFFVYRQLTIRRPLFNLSVFKYKNFIIGLIFLALYYGLKDSLNLIYSYTGVILQWSPIQIIQLGFFNLAGLIGAMWVSSRLILTNRHSTRKFLIIGFGLLLVYHLYMYYLLTPDLAFTDLILPVFLQGTASGMLFVPIIVFTLSSLPASTGTTGTVIGACVRFTATLNSVAGFENLQLYFNQHYKVNFLGNLSMVDFTLTERVNDYIQLFKGKGFSAEQANSLAISTVARLLGVQNQLLTNKSIFLLFSIVLLVILGAILLITSFNRTNLHLRKSMFVLTRK